MYVCGGIPNLKLQWLVVNELCRGGGTCEGPAKIKWALWDLGLLWEGGGGRGEGVKHLL